MLNSRLVWRGMLQTCYKHVTNMLQTCYKHVTNMLQTCYKHVRNMLQTCYKHATNMLQTCYKHATNMLQTCYKHATNMLQTCYKHVDIHYLYLVRSPGLNPSLFYTCTIIRVIIESIGAFGLGEGGHAPMAHVFHL